jgi:4-azaleucine resistance transporter AzlC
MQDGFCQGLKSSVPVVLGYGPLGLAFGILAAQQGFTLGMVFLMSLLVYAGSAQFIAVAMLGVGASVWAIIAATFLVNIRHLLMSASLSPHLRGAAAHLQAMIAYGLTDETFAVGITRARDRDVRPTYFIGLHLASHAAWIAFTVAGCSLGALVPDPSVWGIDFALAAMFIGLLAMQIKNRIDVWTGLAAGLASLAIALLMVGNWNIIIAAVCAASLGVWIERWKKNSSSLS